jgi:hypothetical protein
MDPTMPLPDPRHRLHIGAFVVMAALSASKVFAQEPAPARVPLSYGTPGTHVIVLEKTLIRVITDQPLSSKRSRDGTPVLFTVSQDVVVNHVLVIPRGATVHGEVIQHKKAGRLSGSPELTLKLLTLDLGGESYPLYTYQFRVRGESKTPPAPDDLVQAAYYGAIAGDIVAARTAKEAPTRASTAEDMAAGAAVAAGVVAAASAITPRPVLAIPAESQMDFYLTSPISVQPVSAKEAERLGQRLHPGGPVLYVRGDTP